MTLPPWLRTWAGLALVLSLVLGVAGTASLALEIGQQFGGYTSFSETLDPTGSVADETPGWWPIFDIDSEARQAIFLTANGLPYTENVRRLFSEARPGDVITLGVLDRATGEERELAVPVILFTATHFLDLALPELIVAISFWMLGLVVLRANPNAPTNRAFAALSALIAAHRLLAANVIFSDNRFLPALLGMGLLAISSFVGAVAFHFAWLYPSPLPRRPRSLILLFYIAGGILAVLMALTRVTRWPAGMEPPNSSLNAFAYPLVLYLYLIGLAAIVARLFYAFVRENNTLRERRILLLTAGGMLLAAPFLILAAGEVLPGIETSLFWNNLDLRYLLIAVPLALALAIVRYQNMTAPSTAFVLVAVLAASAFLANLAAWLWQLAAAPRGERLMPSIFLPLFAGILLASLFWSFQSTWSGWLGRFFQREQLNFTATRNLGRRMQQSSGEPDLPQTLVQAVAEELQLNGAALWLVENDATQFRLSAATGDFQPPLPVLLAVPEQPAESAPIRLGAGQALPSWLTPLAGHPDLPAVMPLAHEQEAVALLGFGRRWDEDIFDRRDLVLLELVGQQALLSIQVSQQIDELRRVPHVVSAAQERERTLLAAELHDTIQQFLGRLPFFLMASKEAMLDDPQEAGELLERSLDDIKQAAVTVQQIRQNLAPSQLERSLTRSLKSLAAHVEHLYGLDVPLDLDEAVDPATTLETRRALYRVIQHALNNAVTHAKAQTVAIDLGREDGRVVFTVRDDGRGTSEEAVALAREEGHFGLQSMQARLEAVGGQLFFETAVDHGTQVSGWVPADQNGQE